MALTKPGVDMLENAYVASANHTVSSANYDILDNDGYYDISLTTAASDRTVTLPTLAANQGRKIRITKADTGAGKVIIEGEGAETINGEANYYLNYVTDTVEFVGTGSTWVANKKESVYFRCSSNTAQNITASIPTMIYEDVGSDARSTYNNGTGIWTAPRSGLYMLACNMTSSTVGNTTSQFFGLAFEHNVTRYWGPYVTGSGASNYQSAGCSITLRVVKSDTLKIVAYNSQNTTRVASTDENWWTIASID